MKSRWCNVEIAIIFWWLWWEFSLGVAVSVGLLVKLSLWANLPWGGKGPPCQSLKGEGVGKAWYDPLVSLETQFIGHLSAVRLSSQILEMFQADWPVKGFPSPTCSVARPCQAWGVTWPWMLCLGLASLKLPLSSRAGLKQLEMARLRISFWWRWIQYFFTSQEPRAESPYKANG